MRSFFLACCAAFSAATATAQDIDFPIYAGFSVQAGGSYYSGFRLASLDRFTNSYNAYYASRLTTPLGDLSPTSSVSFGGGGYIGPLYFNVVQHRTTTETAAVFKDGSRRELKLDFHPLDANFDLMFPAGKRLGLGMALGLQLQKARLYSGLRYPTGDLSYAGDNPLNGIFDFWSNSTVNLGARVDIKVVKLRGKSFLDLSLRGERVGVFSGKSDESTASLLPHRDQMMNTSTGGPQHSDGALHFYLPEQAEDQNNDYVYFVNVDGTTLHGLYKGWRVSASLILTLKEWHLN